MLLPEIGEYFNERFISYQFDHGVEEHLRSDLIIQFDFQMIADQSVLS